MTKNDTNAMQIETLQPFDLDAPTLLEGLRRNLKLKTPWKRTAKDGSIHSYQHGKYSLAIGSYNGKITQIFVSRVEAYGAEFEPASQAAIELFFWVICWVDPSLDSNASNQIASKLFGEIGEITDEPTARETTVNGITYHASIVKNGMVIGTWRATDGS